MQPTEQEMAKRKLTTSSDDREQCQIDLKQKNSQKSSSTKYKKICIDSTMKKRGYYIIIKY